MVRKITKAELEAELQEAQKRIAILEGEPSTRSEETRYHSLFEESPLCLWEEDFSQVKDRLDQLKQCGVTDLREYLYSHPDFVAECATLVMILNVNKTALKVYEAERKEDLLHKLDKIISHNNILTFADELLALESGEKTYYWEGTNYTLKGRKIQVEIYLSILPEYAQSWARVIVSTVDVTKRKLAEEELHKSEERYRSITEDTPVMICRFLADGTLTFVNSFYCHYFNVPYQGLVGSNLFELVPEPERDFVRNKYLSLDKSKPYVTYEHKAFDANGKDCWQRWTDHALFNGQGEVTEYQSIGEDVTEQKQMEAQLEESEARFRALIANTGDLIVVIDAEGKITFASPSSERIFGYAPGETMESAFTDWIHPDDLTEVQVAFQSRKQNPEIPPQIIQVRCHHKDGSWRYVEALGTNLLKDPAINGIVLNIRDVTEQKRADLEKQALYDIMQGMALSQSLGEFLSLVHYSIERVLRARNIFVSLHNPVTGLFEDVYCADEYDAPLGPSSREGTLTSYIFRTGNPILVTDEKFNELVAAGEVKLVGTDSKSWIGVPLKTAGKTIGVIAIQDYEIENLYSEKELAFLASLSGQVASAVEKKQAEERLHESEERFSATFKNAPVGMALVGMSGGIFKANHAFCSLIGFSEDELTSKTFQQITHMDDLKANLNNLEQLLTGNIHSYQMEKRYQHKDGHYVWAALHVSLVKNDKDAPLYLIGLVQDITETKKAGEALRRAEEKYRTIFENSLEGIFQSTPAGRFITVNPALARMWGYDSPEDLVTSITDIAHQVYINPAIREEHIRQLKEHGGNLTGFEYQAYCKDGSTIWVSENVHSIENKDGILLYEGTVENISSRKQAEGILKENEKRYRSLFEDSPISLWEDDYSAVKQKLDELKRAGVTDFETYFIAHPETATECINLIKILDANNFSIKLFNAKDKQELLANSNVFLTEETTNYRELVNFANGLTHFEQEGINKKLTGELMNIKITWTVAPGYENNLSKVLISIIDITERKKAEAEISRQLSELETLYESGLAISRLLTPKEIAQKVIEILDRKMNWHHIAIRQYDADTGTVKLIGFNRAGINPEEAVEYITKLNEVIANPSQGLSGWVTLNGNSLRIPSVKKDKRYTETFPEIHSGIYVPLKIGGRVTGSISVESQEENAFTENDQRLLETLAGQAAIAIENATLFLRTQKEIEERQQAESALQMQTEKLLQLNNELEQRVLERTAEIEMTRKRLQLAADAAGLGIWEWDNVNGRLIWDAQMYRIYGVSPEEFGGKLESVYEYILPEDQAIMADTAYNIVVNFNTNYQIEYRILRKDGEIRTLAQQGVAKFDEYNILDRIIGTVNDITQQKKAEESLRLANTEMERALRMKDEFLANMSHELRTPLNAILGMSESLEEQIAGPLNDKQIKYIRTIGESGKHLLELINDILDLSKIEAGRLDLNITQVSVSTLCEASLRMVREQAQKKSQDISLKIDPEVKIIMGDERRLKQALVNLLSNAVKFTPNEHNVGVEVKGNIRNQTVTFTVWDEGIGMTPEELNLIFKPFVQLDSGLSREFSGTGLGLALVAQMIRLHGGSVSVESKQGRGSRFSFTLPWVDVEGTVSAKNMQQKTGTGPISNEKRSGKILIVEDTDSIIMLLSEYLKFKGYQILVAHNGLEGVTLAIKEKPDLILMDVMMPVMNGVEATQQIRTEKDLQHVPIIALTALAMNGDKERCLQAGMNDYLSKPVQMKELDDLILKHIHKSKDETTPHP
ncbi:MAG: PAS domain S-box protein [Anaerolineales bacterium]|nr:PAS domain S-box protein [Anaerolineales bacterium]